MSYSLTIFFDINKIFVKMTMLNILGEFDYFFFELYCHNNFQKNTKLEQYELLLHNH